MEGIFVQKIILLIRFAFVVVNNLPSLSQLQISHFDPEEIMRQNQSGVLVIALNLVPLLSLFDEGFLPVKLLYLVLFKDTVFFH